MNIWLNTPIVIYFPNYLYLKVDLENINYENNTPISLLDINNLSAQNYDQNPIEIYIEKTEKISNYYYLVVSKD